MHNSPAYTGIELDRPEPRQPAECSVEDWLSFLGHRWNALILWHLKNGARRHGKLTDLLPGISSKVLAERLSGLEMRGLVIRSQIPTFPRGVTYELSENGCALVNILDRLEIWSHKMPGTDT